MRTDDLDYDLPPEAIAQTPVEPRDRARLLVDTGAGTEPVDHCVSDLASLLRTGDLLVVNDTRVLPARVAVRRSTGGGGEVLLLEEAEQSEPSELPGRSSSSGWWQALCRPSRKLAVGDVVTAEHGGLSFQIGEALADGRRLVRPLLDGEAAGAGLLAALAESGVAPLPPYITETLDDAERYQTVFAQRPASAAAPTAGLHLSPEVLGEIAAKGIEFARVELVVGLDTFRPITSDTVEAHEIHSEWYSVPESTWSAVQRTRSAGGRVVAVGTTSVRALESVAASGRLVGRTRLFITPGFRFQVVDVLMTNFHLPRSSLLAMIEAFIGGRWRDMYRTALGRGYRFLSFGDAMLLERTELGTATTTSDETGTTPA